LKGTEHFDRVFPHGDLLFEGLQIDAGKQRKPIEIDAMPSTAM
jgi:hypothetical protein